MAIRFGSRGRGPGLENKITVWETGSKALVFGKFLVHTAMLSDSKIADWSNSGMWILCYSVVYFSYSVNNYSTSIFSSFLKLSNFNLYAFEAYLYHEPGIQEWFQWALINLFTKLILKLPSDNTNITKENGPGQRIGCFVYIYTQQQFKSFIS